MRGVRVRVAAGVRVACGAPAARRHHDVCDEWVAHRVVRDE
ncbi:hypothetical protein ABR738_17275 [Streptomyces sp. Edi4]